MPTKRVTTRNCDFASFCDFVYVFLFTFNDLRACELLNCAQQFHFIRIIFQVRKLNETKKI